MNKEAIEQAKKELLEEEFRVQVEKAKTRIREQQGSLFSKIKKAFTTHKIVIRMEIRK